MPALTKAALRPSGVSCVRIVYLINMSLYVSTLVAWGIRSGLLIGWDPPQGGHESAFQYSHSRGSNLN